MTTIDVKWALEELRSFITVTDQVFYDNSGSSVVVLGTHLRGTESEAAERAHIVEKIVDRVIPRWPRQSAVDSSAENRWSHLRHWTSRAIAQLERQDEIQEKLGDNAPQMDAGLLHQWVWNGAASLWHTGHYRQAVDQAAIYLNAETQAKVDRRDVSETKLFQQAFSTNDADPGKTRLRLMPDDGSDTFRSVHRGAMAMAEGLYAAIRNPIAHEVGEEMGEQEALEHLAAFSILARWVDRATVVRAT